MQSFAIEQGVRNLAMGAFEDVAHGLARNSHAQCYISLVQTIEIGQTYRFEFVHFQSNFGQGVHRHTAWLEVVRNGGTMNTTLLLGTSHGDFDY